MLHLLEIENYAVIEKLRVGFHAGLNLLTGETGSGKSIVVDALGLLLGARASGEVVRTGTARARVAGVFEVDWTPELEAAGAEPENGELLIEREILAEGKSRAFLNGRVTTLGVLREIAPWLGDIHGQHEQQDLFQPQTQIEMLDDYSGSGALREQVSRLYAAWSEAGRRLEELRGNEQEKLRLLDLWKFQHKEITQAAPAAGEDQRLEEEKRVLANVVRILEWVEGAYEALYESPGSAVAQVKQAARALEDLARFDASQGAMAETLRGARITLEEAARDLRQYRDRLEANPDRLGEVEDRRALIEKLKRKYGPGLEDVVAFGERAGRQIQEFESREETIREVEKDQKRLAGEYEAEARKLSEQRRQGARRLQGPLEKELAALAMERTRFEVEIEAAEWTARGVDQVRFLVSPNPGEPPRPLEMVASGGELSRITLALKTCLAGPAKTRRPRTLVFDEIDAGVGGRAAEAVGRRLHRLSRTSQVLCVTHLPQIAGFADHHYHVDKQVRGGRTVATLEELAGPQRVEELARMLSGARVTPEAMRHAQQLIQAARA